MSSIAGFIVDIVPPGGEATPLPEEISKYRRELRERLLESDDVEVSDVVTGAAPPGTRGTLDDLSGGMFVAILTTVMVTGTGKMIKRAAKQLRKDAGHVKEASTDLRHASEDFKDAAAEVQVVIDNFVVGVRAVATTITAQLRGFQRRHPELSPVVSIPGRPPLDVKTSTDEAIRDAITNGVVAAVITADDVAED